MNDTSRDERAPRARFPYRRLLLVGAGLVVLALVLAFAAMAFAPGVIRAQIVKASTGALTRTPSIGKIGVNPFRFEVQIRDFRLTDADSLEVLGFDRLGARLNPFPLLTGVVTLTDVTIIRPRGRVVILPNGDLNWATLIRTADTTAASSAKEPPVFNLHRLTIADGALLFLDRTRAPAYEQALRPINLELRHFSTRKDNSNGYSLDAASRNGEQLAWRGTFTMSPLRSNGTLAISKLRAESVGRLLGPYLPFELHRGMAEFSAHYDLDGSSNPARLRLRDLGTSLRGVALEEKVTRLPLIEVAALETRGGSVDVLRRQVDLGTVSSSGGACRLYMREDGHLNYEKWAEPTGPADTTKTWVTTIPGLTVSGWKFTFEDRRLNPAAEITVPACSVVVRNFSTLPGSRFALDATAGLNGGGSARITGDVVPSAPRSDLDVDLRDFDLRELMPYVGMAARIRITRGTASAKGRLATRPAGGAEPMLRFTGAGQSRNFSSVDTHSSNEFLSWGRLELRNLSYDFMPSRLSAREVVMTRPYVRVVVGPDRTLNLQDIAVPPDSLPPAFRQEPGHADTLPTRIDLVTIKDGAMFFSDRSLTPNFATGIQHLNGQLQGLSSSAASHADLDLSGQVDAYAPVHIFGTLNPLTEEQHSDVTLDFKNIELSTFTAYSGKFMGYPIERGKLSLALNYKVDGRHLQGENKILIEQISLGQKTDSPDATKLPIKFAIALLKDKNGNIDLDVPVSGDLDDPKFNIWRIVLKVLMNLITKLVTSPFKLMGALFGGGEDAGLDSVSFAPGSAALAAPQAHKLESLGKGLMERPALRLEISESADAAVDSLALARRRYDRALLDEHARAVKSAPDTLTVNDLSQEEYLRSLSAAYKARFGTVPKLDATPARGLKGAAKDSVLAIATSLWARELEFRLRSTMGVEPADVALLARARTDTIKSWLITRAAVPPERIYVVTSKEPVVADSSAVQVKLTLEGS